MSGRSKSYTKEGRMLYFLERKEYDYDEQYEMLVRADSVREARAIASQSAKVENPRVWLNAKKATCKRIKEQGKAGVIYSRSLYG